MFRDVRIVVPTFPGYPTASDWLIARQTQGEQGKPSLTLRSYLPNFNPLGPDSTQARAFSTSGPALLLKARTLCRCLEHLESLLTDSDSAAHTLLLHISELLQG